MMNFLDERLPPRFWDKLTPEPNSGCWLWTAATNPQGYGRFRVAGKNLLPHRVAYTQLVAEIPAGLHVDHLCRTPACCNPAHLEPVTHGENIRRGITGEVNARRQNALTHCKRGHEFNALNTLVLPSGYRECRPCHRLKDQRRRSKAVAS